MIRKYKDSFRKLMELAILFGALFAIDNFWLSGDAFANLNPNPYWLPVLVMAMTYGTGTGLVAVVFASLLWISTGDARPAGTDSLESQLHLTTLPMLWAIAAMIIGEVTTSRRAKTDQLEQRNQELENDWENIANALARLNKINRNLQVRIATEPHVAGQAITAAAGLVQRSPASQIDAITRLIALAVQTEDFTYYHVRGNQLVALLQGADALGRPIDASQMTWAREMVANPGHLLAAREQDRQILGGFGIAAIPVFDEHTGALAATLVVHSAQRLRLTIAKIAEFSQIAEALSRFTAILAKPYSIASVEEDAAEGRVA